MGGKDTLTLHMHNYVIIEKLTWYQLIVYFMLFLGCTTWPYTYVCTLQNMFGICFWKSFLLLYFHYSFSSFFVTKIHNLVINPGSRIHWCGCETEIRRKMHTLHTHAYRLRLRIFVDVHKTPERNAEFEPSMKNLETFLLEHRSHQWPRKWKMGHSKLFLNCRTSGKCWVN